MFVNSALNEGLAGMQQSQKKMAQAAQDIVNAGLPPDQVGKSASSGRPAPVSDAGTGAELPANQQIQDASNVPASEKGYAASGSGDVVSSLVETKRQQHIFDASANVVQVASQTLGSLIDDLS